MTMDELIVGYGRYADKIDRGSDSSRCFFCSGVVFNRSRPVERCLFIIGPFPSREVAGKVRLTSNHPVENIMIIGADVETTEELIEVLKKRVNLAKLDYLYEIGSKH